MKVIETKLPGVLIIEPKVFGDARGYFQETWNQVRYEEAGITDTFVQDNLSFSTRGVLRGLHYQNPHGQGKLVAVVKGEVFDVAVDIRVGSPHFGQWAGVYLSDENHRQLWIPPGFAHGFCVVSDTVYFAYKCTALYTPQAEGGILWNDPAIGIEWPVADVNLSEKDTKYPCLGDVPQHRLPVYGKQPATGSGKPLAAGWTAAQ
ncbi:dTDP-4-dehydrorhamnose 3,5-epimerase [Propionispora sp. 2/2-37]|uniref:dTDP-4-dehydrorhamnose 3,5-epimerase n=1 Tax=Propionispora sp. 2/2-37 TaxID=1677858 RepID=UPI0006BB7046|nr:dTDP-4-dehydrorhamnose 3,5-epimerase [Propionispora sp. 2/2-37]CUH94464.1 dTDP-4-dehydrorhamnose 3,5-epimerase [Propionispora sp. 2/2-37]